jgi:hypothetical protein
MTFEPHQDFIVGLRAVDLVKAIGIIVAALVAVVVSINRANAKRRNNMQR